MDSGICLWMCVAMRAEPRHASEMVNQLLFGESYHVEEYQPEWVRISTDDYDYQGWISRKQHTALSDQEYSEYRTTEKSLVTEPLLFITDGQSGIRFPIAMGSTIPCPESGRFHIGGHHFAIAETAAGLCPLMRRPVERAAILQLAQRYLNAPYLWGGRTPAGIDCSGFVQMVFRMAGIALPRDASQQVAIGKPLDFLQEADAGDIAFFENESGAIVHTGILCNNHQIIHASGFVQINDLDETGIFHPTLSYTHRLRVIKRLLH